MDYGITLSYSLPVFERISKVYRIGNMLKQAEYKEVQNAKATRKLQQAEKLPLL